MLKLYYELIKNLNVGTHAERAAVTQRETNAHTHTHTDTHTSTPLASSSCASSYYSWAAALCSLINKEKNTLCTMLNVIKIHNNTKKKYLFLLHNAA